MTNLLKLLLTFFINDLKSYSSENEANLESARVCLERQKRLELSTLSLGS
jgi:hypothetical protein